MIKHLLHILIISFILFNNTISAQKNGEIKGDTISLREVVIKASSPIAKIEGDGMITNVAGTVLQQLGTARDVLGFIPGVITSPAGGIEVFGKGSPVIYINGRKVLNTGDIDRLSSNRIKNIKVITTPGARYDSSVSSVIRITTIREEGEGYALDNKASLGYRDYLYGKDVAWMNYRTGGLDMFSTLEYDNNRMKGKGHIKQNCWTPAKTSTNIINRSKARTQLYNGQLGLNYMTESGHSFGAYYQISHKPSTTKGSNISSLNDQNGESTVLSTLSDHRKTSYYEHLVDGYYTGTWSGWLAEASFDLLWRNNREHQNSEEISGSEKQTVNIYDRYLGRMIAGELNLTHELWKGNMNVGVSFTNTQRKDLFINTEKLMPDNDDRVIENNLGIYVQTMQNFGKLSAMVGLRYEYTDNNYYNHGVRQTEQSKKYHELIPSMTLTLPVRKATFQLGYSRLVNRPSYAHLSSAVTYVNQNLYESGNPNLKNSYTDNISLIFRWKCLMLMTDYRRTGDRVITTATEYENNPEITLLKRINSPHHINTLQAIASIMPGFIGQMYYPVLSFGIVAQHYKVNYRDGIKNMNRPMPIVRLNNILRFKGDYMLWCNLSWRGKGDTENITMSDSWNIDIVAQKVINKNWDLKLTFTDIFNTADHSSFTIFSGDRDFSNYKHMTTRSVELTVGYKFNVTKSKYKGKGAAESEKERL